MPLDRRSFLFSLPLVAATTGSAQVAGRAGSAASAPALPTAVQERIHAIVRTEMVRRRIPGLSLAIAQGNLPVWSQSYGFADLEQSVPVVTNSRFRTASIAKPITAVTVLRLVEAGRADLDRDIRQYFPEFPEKRWPITLRQLLGNLGGIRSYQGNESNSATHYQQVSEGLAMFSTDPLVHQPGTKYLYSTYGFNLAGVVAERIASMPFRRLLQSSVFDPAGMVHTRDDHHFAIIPNRVSGYRKNSRGQIENCVFANTSNKIPGGGLLSTSTDLVLFARALMQGRLLSDRLRRDMWTSQRTTDKQPTGYGMGWQVGRMNERNHVGHTGGQAGTATMLDVLPQDNLAVAVMTNLEGSAPREISAEIIAALLPPPPQPTNRPRR
jgi:CubicO group peptidase (beta-lactamase class C family)